MLVYRIFAYDPGAKTEDESGHHGYIYRPQDGGRVDNPTYYDARYYAVNQEAAVAEVFGSSPTWTEAMFATPYLPTGRRALGTFEIPDDTRLLDLDDASALLSRGLRPSQVVSKNLAVTQSWALAIHQERTSAGLPKWDGIKWWSYWRPTWPVLVRWTAIGAPAPHRLVKVERLSLTHPAVDAARTSLSRL